MLTHDRGVRRAGLVLLGIGVLSLLASPAAAQALHGGQPVPSELDYTEHLTLLRDQGSGGGCGGYTTIHIFDMLSERLASFTPDASIAFLHHVYNVSMGFSGLRDARVSVKNLDQFGTLKRYGCCPETFYRDQRHPLPLPADVCFSEAGKRRISGFSGRLHLDRIEELKRILWERGPVLCIGWSPGHVVAIAGFNDKTKKVKIVNSGPAGIREHDFLDAMARFRRHRHPAVVRWLAVPPPESLVEYVARIRISHTVGRRYLTVRLGIPGLSPMVVWDRNHASGTFLDRTKDLTIDVPMPSYAADHWPPDPERPWFVEIQDCSPASASAVIGQVEQVTLARRSLGRRPLLHDFSLRGAPLPKRTTMRFYVPPHEKCTLTLSKRKWKEGGLSQARLEGNLFKQVSPTNRGGTFRPCKGHEVRVYRLKSDESPLPSSKCLIGTTKVNEQGRYWLALGVSERGVFQAFAVGPDGLETAASNLLHLENGD